MIDYILQKLFEYYPQVSTYFIIILVVVFVVYKFTIFYKDTKDNNRKFGEIEGSLNKIDEDNNKKFGEIEGSLNRIDKGFTTLNQILLEKNVISKSCYSEENSPRVINKIGLKLYSESGAEKLFDNIKDELLLELEKKHFDSLLELERSSLDVLMDKMNDIRFKDIQNFAFEHPTFDNNPLTYTDLLFIMSLKLREAYREKYPQSNLG